MKAFVLEELGRPGSIRDIEVPEPAPGEVRIRVGAAGLNPFDAFVAQGALKDRMEHRFPLLPGADASGTIEAVGDDVSDLAAGDDVFGSVGKMYLGGGTLAEFATMSTGTIARKPTSVDHAAAAAVPVAGVTAQTMIEAATISNGDVVVVIGATGGVGSYFVQLAANYGARVVAVCSEEKSDYARRLGAADVIDYTSDDVVGAVRSRFPDGINVIADMHGDGNQVSQLAENVRSGGRVTSAVGAADADSLKRRNIEATNVMGNVSTATLEPLAVMLDKGELKTPELRSFQLSEAGEALAAVASGHTAGKIVVLP